MPLRRSSSEPFESAPLAPLADVRVDGFTRGSFILRGALATAAVYGAGAVSPFVNGALAQSDATDAGILDFALRLESLEAAFYDEALKQVPGMSRDVRAVTKTLRDHEHEHRVTIAETILQLGISNSPPPKLQFGDAFASEARFLEVAQMLEDTGVSAYNGAAPTVFSRRVLAIAGQIVQVEARHAAVVRDLRGEPITAGAFDKAEKAAQVAQKVKPFLKG
jgi:rubrerythrin